MGFISSGIHDGNKCDFPQYWHSKSVCVLASEAVGKVYTRHVNPLLVFMGARMLCEC